MFSEVTGVPAPGDEQAGNATIEEMGWELFRHCWGCPINPRPC